MNNIPKTIEPEILKDVEWVLNRKLLKNEIFYDGYIIRFENTVVNIIRILYTKRKETEKAKSIVKDYCILSYTTSDRNFVNKNERPRKFIYHNNVDVYFHQVYDSYEEALNKLKVNYKKQLEKLIEDHKRAYSYLINIETI